MKLNTFFRASALASLLLLAVGCAKQAEPYAEIFPLEGLEHPVYYTAPTPLSDGDNGELAIIMIQGWHGGVQVLNEQLSLQKAFPGTYVLSPMYPRGEMMDAFNIAPDGRAVWNDSWNRVDLSKPGVPDDDWRGGGDANGTTFSSFEVIDHLFAKLSDKTLFPNLKRIALVGFSAGGQFVGRYVAVGKAEVREGIEVVYAAMAPSTFLRLEPEDIWHYGLKGRPRYSRDISHEQILENLRTRRCLHACGAKDTLEESLDKTATAMKQGYNRYVRFLNFREVVGQDEQWKASTVFHTFEDLGHDAVSAYADPFFVKYIKE